VRKAAIFFVMAGHPSTWNNSSPAKKLFLNFVLGEGGLGCTENCREYLSFFFQNRT